MIEVPKDLFSIFRNLLWNINSGNDRQMITPSCVGYDDTGDDCDVRANPDVVNPLIGICTRPGESS